MSILQGMAAKLTQPALPMQAKAYSTRVGAGAYPTEIKGSLADKLREVGHEYGVTTGRPRRVGWLDMPALTYATRCGACLPAWCCWAPDCQRQLVLARLGGSAGRCQAQHCSNLKHTASPQHMGSSAAARTMCMPAAHWF